MTQPTAARLEKARQAARVAWPSLDLADQTFVNHLAVCAAGGDMDKLNLPDLYLAWACAEGDKAALAEFERRHVPALRKTLLGRGESTSIADEVVQQLRLRLFVPSAEGPAKITEYAGRAPLAQWLRVVVVRLALNHKRSQKREVALDDSRMHRMPVSEDDPELGYIKSHYRKEFVQAFDAAFAGLSSRQRTLLRMQLIERLDTPEIARMYRVGASTARRWLAEARQLLIDATRTSLKSRLRLSRSQFNSLLRVVQSELEVSIHRTLLKTSGERDSKSSS